MPRRRGGRGVAVASEATTGGEVLQHQAGDVERADRAAEGAAAELDGEIDEPVGLAADDDRVRTPGREDLALLGGQHLRDTSCR